MQIKFCLIIHLIVLKNTVINSFPIISEIIFFNLKIFHTIVIFEAICSKNILLF